MYDFGLYMKNNLVVLYDRKFNPYKDANDFLAIVLLSHCHYNIIIKYILYIWLEKATI